MRSVTSAARHPVERDAGRDDRRLGPRASAAGAVVAAEVAEVDRVVDVGRAAVAAVLGVGGVLQLGQRLRVVLDAEVDDALAPAAEVGDERVVGVQHEARLAVLLGDQAGPAVGERLELAVAVELVAEEVRQQVGAGVQGTRDLRQPGLVDLEQAELAAPRRASSSAVATPQPMFEPALLWTTCSPERSRIAAIIAAVVVLPLVAETTAAPSSSSLAHPVERARADAQQQPAGERRAAAAAEAAAERAHGAGEQAPEAEHQRGTITRRQRGSTSTRAGTRRSGRRRRRS